MKYLLLPLAALLLAGCGKEPLVDQHVYDQCLRARLFKECLAAVPASPTHVAAAASGWAGVVDECASAAQYQSLRLEAHVKPECRP